jgi:XTP/dITP diphosphohydrolase
MNEVVLATKNVDKAAEMGALLADLGIRVRTLAEFSDAPDVVEDGDTCRANAVKKARAIADHTHRVAIADDTGLEVEALGGRPGVYAARYAGEHATYDENCRKLIDELRDVRGQDRRARFITAVAIARPFSAAVETVEGYLDGVIAEHPSGSAGFGYDPVFFVPELGKTLAELPQAEKNRISHRAQAFAKAQAILSRLVAAGT